MSIDLGAWRFVAPSELDVFVELIMGTISLPVNLFFGEFFVTIGGRLKEERGRLGMNQPDFAALAGTTKKSQITYEKGVMPDAAYLAAIAAAGADVRYIVTGDREGPAPEVLSSDERELLTLFRAAPLAVKASAIGALKGGTTPPPKKTKTVSYGKVGTKMGDNTGTMTINMGGKKK